MTLDGMPSADIATSLHMRVSRDEVKTVMNAVTADGGDSAFPQSEMPVIPECAEDRVQLSDSEFKAQLTAIVPHLRAFGRSLSGNRDLADDLVQETLLKAWAARSRFQAGTNMRAWTFIILRNHYLSQVRRNRFRGEWDDLTAERILAGPASQDRHIDLGDLHRALQELPQPQREALILVGAGGFAYEEAAEICGVAVGTIKSRVARGRSALETILEQGALPARSTHVTTGEGTLVEIMDEVDRISEGR
jgi:RNA polymerase sigma-70 factor (ECF subfamily)